MTKPKPKIILSIRISRELYKSLVLLAKKENKTISAIGEGVMWEGVAVIKRTQYNIIQ